LLTVESGKDLSEAEDGTSDDQDGDFDKCLYQSFVTKCRKGFACKKYYITFLQVQPIVIFILRIFVKMLQINYHQMKETMWMIKVPMVSGWWLA